MTQFVCQTCGNIDDQAFANCPHCGAKVVDNLTTAFESSQDHRLRLLLTEARRFQEEGNITAAISIATKALTIRDDCSTTHALLGHLYEHQGNMVAARQHFQSALQVTEHCPAPEETSLANSLPHVTTQRKHSSMMLALLIGCIIFSGLAALFAFQNVKRPTVNGTVFEIQPIQPHALPNVPPWTWRVPVPVKITASNPATSGVTTERTPPQQTERAGILHNPSDGNQTLLGPSGQQSIISVAIHPSLEEADQAYFKGEYDRATTIYEAVLAQDDIQNPRVYQDLAWCYQQLGNSPEATEYLVKAINGYKSLLATNPGSTTTQQSLDSCEAALRSLLTTRESSSNLP